MKRVILATSILLAAGTLSAGELVEAIVARVGDRIITRSQYTRRLKAGLEEIEQAAPADQKAGAKAEFRKNLLNEMLSEILLKDRADRLGITVTEAETQDSVKRLMEQYGIKTDEQFEESLKKSGLNRKEMESRLRDTILTQKLFSRELRSREDLEDKELRERYEREKESYRLPERAKVRELIVLVPENATEAQKQTAKLRAEEAYAKARAGADFAKVVGEYSEAPTKEKGGDIGQVTRGELLPVLDSGVFASDAGSIVGPVETRFGYHVLQIESRLPSEVPGFDSVKERLRKDATDETFQRDFKAYVDKLRNEAFIQIFEENLPTA